MTEHAFIRSVHKKLHPDVYRWKIHDTYTGGVPDSYYMGPAGALFVEYKFIKTLPKRDTTVLRTCLSPLQIAWLTRAEESTPAVALVIGNAQKGVIICNDFGRAVTKAYFNENSLPIAEIAGWISRTALGGEHEQSTPKGSRG